MSTCDDLTEPEMRVAQYFFTALFVRFVMVRFGALLYQSFLVTPDE